MNANKYMQMNKQAERQTEMKTDMKTDMQMNKQMNKQMNDQMNKDLHLQLDEKEAKTIYIADDETNIREAIKTFLENAGYAVNAFENGTMLLEAFAEQAADLIILDVMMPGPNGFTVCKELRKSSGVPIILLTARDSDLDYMTGLDLGGDDYFTKPFSPMSLVMRVKAIFRRVEYDRLAFAGGPA